MADEDDVLAANRAFYAAFESLDVDAIGRAWSDLSPITCIHPAWELIEGRDEVLASWRRIVRGTSSIKFLLRDEKAYVAGDTAWVVLIEQIEARHETERVEATTQATNVFRRERGVWKLIHHHAAPVRLAEEPKRPSQLN